MAVYLTDQTLDALRPSPETAPPPRPQLGTGLPPSDAQLQGAPPPPSPLELGGGDTGPLGPMGPQAPEPPPYDPYAPENFQPGGDYGGGQLVPEGSLGGDIAAAGRGYAALTQPGVDPESVGGGPVGHLVGALTTPATYMFGLGAVPAVVGAQLGGEATQYALEKPTAALPEGVQPWARIAEGLVGGGIGAGIAGLSERALPSAARAVNAAGDEAALQVPRETSAVMPGTAVNAAEVGGAGTRFIRAVSGASLTPEEIEMSQAHLSRSLDADQNLRDGLATVLDSLRQADAFHAMGGREAENVAGRIEQARGAEANLSNLPPNASLEQRAQAYESGWATGPFNRALIPAAQITPEQNAAIANLIDTNPALNSFEKGTLTRAAIRLLNGDTLPQQQKTDLLSVLGPQFESVLGEKPPLPARGSGIPADYPASFENNALWNPDAMYRQSNGEGGFVTGSSQLGETPPIPRTPAEQAASAARYSEATTPEGAAQAIPRPGGGMWNPIPEQGLWSPEAGYRTPAGADIEGNQWPEVTSPPLAPQAMGATDTAAMLARRRAFAESITVPGEAQAINPERAALLQAGERPPTPDVPFGPRQQTDMFPPNALEDTQATRVDANGNPVGGRVEAPLNEQLHADAQAVSDRYVEEQAAKNQPPKNPNLIIRGARALADDVIGTIHNTARAVMTLADFASYLRLAPSMGAHAVTYAKGAWNATRAAVVRDPQAFIDASHATTDAATSVVKGIAWNDRGITVAKMFDPEIMGAHGAGYNPSTGERDIGNGLGLLNKVTVGKLNQRLATLNLIKESVIPSMVKEQIENDIRSGKLPADFNLNEPGIGKGVAAREQYEQNVATAKTYAQSSDLLMGHAAWRPLGAKGNPSMQMLMNFGNWWAAQGELLGRAGYADAKSLGNILTGGKFGDLSPANLEARKSVNALALYSSTAFLGANAAQGLKVDDPRNYRNGHVVLVINPTGGWLPKVPGFKDNTQIDTPLGAYYGHFVSAITAGVNGAQQGTTKGEQAWLATLGVSGDLASWARTLAAYLPARALDVAYQKTAWGDPLTVANQVPSPINASNFLDTRPRAAGAAILAAFGGRPVEPSPSKQVQYDPSSYTSMPADVQFKATRPYAWNSIQGMYPADTKDFKSYFDWFRQTQHEYERQFESQGLPASAAQEKAQQFLQLHPVVQAYTAAHNQLEDQWALDHPREAAKLLDSESTAPWQDKTFRPSKPVRDALNAVPR